jgi:hypothetical protein
MGRMIQDEHEFGLGLDFDPTWETDDRISGPEFIFHGTPWPWDKIYEDGGLQAVGMNPDIDAHVHSSWAAVN